MDKEKIRPKFNKIEKLGTKLTDRLNQQSIINNESIIRFQNIKKHINEKNNYIKIHNMDYYAINIF